jgi:hypothetical protein
MTDRQIAAKVRQHFAKFANRIEIEPSKEVSHGHLYHS